MINERMYQLGSQPNMIRKLYAYGLDRKAEVGEENVFDYSIGNPSIPAPDAVRTRIEELLEEPAEQLHAYTMSPGLQSAGVETPSLSCTCRAWMILLISSMFLPVDIG